MSRRLLLGVVGAGILALVLIGSTVFLIGVYYLHWEGSVVERIASVVPIPAARVGSRSVSLHTYLDDVQSIQRYLSSPEAERQSQRRPVVMDDKKQALERLIQEQVLHEMAEARSITVTDQQRQAVMQELAVATTSTDAFVAFLDENYGWSMDEFQTHVVNPLILTRLLSESYAADHGGDLSALGTYVEARVQERDVVRYLKF